MYRCSEEEEEEIISIPKPTLVFSLWLKLQGGKDLGL